MTPLTRRLRPLPKKPVGVRARRQYLEHSTIIQDIYSLIHKSAVVVCDFSGKNPNVFYEAGIAHSLGRPVIPIVQHAADIPFDLQHHRAIIYHNNSEGLEKLKTQLAKRIETLLASWIRNYDDSLLINPAPHARQQKGAASLPPSPALSTDPKDQKRKPKPTRPW